MTRYLTLLLLCCTAQAAPAEDNWRKACGIMGDHAEAAMKARQAGVSLEKVLSFPRNFVFQR
jgi:hypothetical protein